MWASLIYSKQPNELINQKKMKGYKYTNKQTIRLTDNIISRAFHLFEKYTLMPT